MRRIASLVALAAGIVAAVPGQTQTLPSNLSAVIEKSQSFGLNSYPVSFWSYTNLADHGRYMDKAEVEEWADAGFTVPQTPRFDPADPAQVEHVKRLLDWAHERGMKLIVCDPRCYAGKEAAPEYAEGVRAAVRDFGDHPATLGFHVGDEPGADAKDGFFESYRIQKEIAPHLHPFANLLPHYPGAPARAGAPSWPEYLDEYVRESNADLISYDCYTQMNPGVEGWDRYYENLRLYRDAAVRNGVPFWNTVLSVGHFRYRCPNLDEIRWQFNTTLAFGAHGISWFFYYMRHPHANYRRSPVDEHWNRTQTYEDLRVVQKSFHRHYGDLFTRLATTRVSFYPEPFGGCDRFSPNGVVASVSPDREGHPILIGEFADKERRRYVMIVNNSMTESVNVGVMFPGEDVRVFSWDWSGAEVEGGAYSASRQTRDENGVTIRHWLAPGQEAVYRVQSSSAARESIPHGHGR